MVYFFNTGNGNITFETRGTGSRCLQTFNAIEIRLRTGMVGGSNQGCKKNAWITFLPSTTSPSHSLAGFFLSLPSQSRSSLLSYATKIKQSGKRKREKKQTWLTCFSIVSQTNRGREEKEKKRKEKKKTERMATTVTE